MPATGRRHRLRRRAEAGYSAVQSQGRTGVQKVIVLLSDGAANEGQNCDDVVTTTTPLAPAINKHTVTTTTKDQDPQCLQPCQRRSTTRPRTRRRKVLVYSILYGDQSDAPYCQDYDGDNELPHITPQTADAGDRRAPTR